MKRPEFLFPKMHSVLAVLCLATLAACKSKKLGKHGGYLKPKIVGGKSVEIEDFPYQVSMMYKGSHSCGGSIIAPKFILTAAHCTNGVPAADLSVRVGSSIRNSGGKVAQVKHVHLDTFNESNADFDNAILELQEDLAYGPAVQPVKLVAKNQATRPGSVAVVSGWGLLEEGGDNPKQLQAVEVPVIAFEECEGYYEGKFTENMMCAGYPEGGRDSCQQDSGGPLVYNGQQIGIVSWGLGCAREGSPGIYSDVAVARDFIAKVTGL